MSETDPTDLRAAIRDLERRVYNLEIKMGLVVAVAKGFVIVAGVLPLLYFVYLIGRVSS